VGLTAQQPAADSRADLVLVTPVGGQIFVETKRMALASVETLQRILSQNEVGSVSPSNVQVVVADRVTEQARQSLRETGWSWLDLRGHLHLVGEGLFVDAEVPGLRMVPNRSKPLSGRVAQEVAALLLLAPATPASIREIARKLNRSASTISQAIAGMKQALLVNEHRKPVVPDLFWELAKHWHPTSTDVLRLPSPAVDDPINEALRLGLNDVESTLGWALTDTTAAVAFGAPIGARSDHPPDFYVPDKSIMRRATQLLGAAPNSELRGATIRVAPFPLVCARRITWPSEVWPLARPLFVALDLARDPGRGLDVLQSWTPPTEAGHRVW
jgi:hypothetical protein